MKFYIIAGEASGDLHGSNLMKALRAQRNDLEFRFWGGDKMSVIAGEPVKHIRDLAFMGFVEVLANIRTITKNIRMCKQDILDYKPDALVLIDYPGFNLRIAEFAKANNIKVLYYISPQVWAWKEGRVKKIRRVVDKMYCILPFEKEFYAKHNYDVEFVGHPLVDAINSFKINAPSKEEFSSKYELSEKPILALLPGSRVQEIKVKLPIMLEAAKEFNEYQIVICGAPNREESFYKSIAGNVDVKVVTNDTYGVLNYAGLAMVTSGTATLETALFKVPQVVCYKGSAISFAIAKRLVKVDYISLVNLIMSQELVKELIQGDLTPQNIVSNLSELKEGEKREKLLNKYDGLIEKLGGGGASENTARKMLDLIQ